MHAAIYKAVAKFSLETIILCLIVAASMAARGTFTGFEPYELTGVRVTDRELGLGSYATVLELEYVGLKCAGKKIHELLIGQGDTSYTCLLYTSPSPRDATLSRMPSSA